jgi:hypothetical protein
MTLTAQEIVDLLEHGVGALPGVDGRFPQISGVKFSFDDDEPVGSQIRNAGIFDEDGETLIAELVRDGVVVNPDAQYRVVTLDFLSAPRFDSDGNFIGAGDGYPFPNTNTDPGTPEEPREVGDPAVVARINRVELEAEGVQTGDATFADDGTEQDALAEYLDDFFNPAKGGDAFDMADVDPSGDERIQNLDFREDTVLPEPEKLEVLGTPGDDRLEGTDADEVIISLGGRYDRIAGGGGADCFDFTFEMADGERTRDLILDFNRDEGDVIDLGGADFSLRVGGVSRPSSPARTMTSSMSAAR